MAASMAASASAAVSPSPAAGYFVDTKKGEVNELKTLLKGLNVERDMNQKREIIKKVIAYMTLGIEVSRLFTEMIMAIETKDIVVKKMVYLYLCNYAHKEPEMALMCINSLRRECDNEDPMVRGLALRSLCNLRLESILEYVQVPLTKSLSDLSAYVRKTAVMGILKLHYLSPNMVESNGYLGHLYRLLQDPDANVVTNVIMVLNELLISQGGMEVTQSTVMNLLNRIGEFSEWGLNVILELVARYMPTSEDETFAIMNLLDPVLRTANSGAVLSTIKCFIRLTANFADLQPQVYARTKPPLLTLITGAHSEIQYSVLKHLEIILPKPAVKGIFDDEYRQFFVRYNEPPHVKHLKVDLLPLIANVANAKDIAAELSEYVTDVDSELSKRAIRSIGRIAVRVESGESQPHSSPFSSFSNLTPTPSLPTHPVVAPMTQSLIDLIDMEMPYVRAEAIVVLAKVMRTFVQVSPMIYPYLSKCLRKVEDSDARSALVWIIGEHGQDIVEAPYLLEPIIDSYDEERSSHLKLQTLTAAMKLFFKRPPEIQHMLGRLLSSAVNDVTNQDVHDRALFYYRLLSADVHVAASLFRKPWPVQPTEAGSEPGSSVEDEKQKLIFDEFNTLAVVFGAPSVKFIQEKYQMNFHNAPFVDNSFEPPLRTSLLSTAPSSSGSTGAALVVNETVNLLDWGDSPTKETLTPASSTTPAASGSVAKVALRRDADMTPQRFQQLWSTLAESFNGKLCTLTKTITTTTEIEVLLRKEQVSIIF